MIIIKKYNEFLDHCNMLCGRIGSYKIKIMDDSITSVQANIEENTQNQVRVDLDYTYYFENRYVKKFFHELFNVTEVPFETYIFVDEDNFMNYIAPFNILDLLLTAEILKSKNIELVRKFQIKSKNGKVRDIIAPSKFLKPGLRQINNVLQKTYDKRNKTFQVAYKKGKSIVDNARPHINSQYCFKIDLHHFFPSCKREQVIKFIRFLFKYSINEEFLMNKFLDIILDNDSLYIGNPVSGTLANAIISGPVKYIHNMCKKGGISFSVYADDMTFGSNTFLDKKFIIEMFNKAFVEQYHMENFTLSEDKCYGVSKNKRKITGVTINHNNQMTVSRKMYNEVRQTLHQLQYDDTSHYDHNKLKGLLAFMNMVDNSGKLERLTTKYYSTIVRYNLMSNNMLRNNFTSNEASEE